VRSAGKGRGSRNAAGSDYAIGNMFFVGAASSANEANSATSAASHGDPQDKKSICGPATQPP
jgi:hypothetical protein